MTTPSYRGTATHTGQSWSASFRVGDETVIALGNTWRRTEDLVREGIAGHMGVDEESFEIVMEMDDPVLCDLADAAHTARQEAARAQEASVTALTRAVKAMRPAHTLRDIAAILGISHQYAYQLARR